METPDSRLEPWGVSCGELSCARSSTLLPSQHPALTSACLGAVECLGHIIENLHAPVIPDWLLLYHGCMRSSPVKVAMAWLSWLGKKLANEQPLP